MLIPLFVYYKIVSKILQNHHTNKNKYKGHCSEDGDARKFESNDKSRWRLVNDSERNHTKTCLNEDVLKKNAHCCSDTRNIYATPSFIGRYANIINYYVRPPTSYMSRVFRLCIICKKKKISLELKTNAIGPH